MTIPEQAQDVVTALRVQVDALAAELERLNHAVDDEQHKSIEAQRQAAAALKHADSLVTENATLKARLALAERAFEAARAMVAMHPKTHKERHWWQYAPCRHSLFVELRQALEGLDESKKQETAS